MDMHIQQRLERLEKQIKVACEKHTIIDNVCIPTLVEPAVKAGQFRQIANKLLIERERISDPENYLLLDEIGASVARAEIEYLVRHLSPSAPSSKIHDITYEEIVHGVGRILDNGFMPNHVFMPIEYSRYIREWNKSKAKRDWTRGGIHNTIYIDEDVVMKVTFSNKYIPFEEIVITSKESNSWEYRPNAHRSVRLTAKFDWNYEDPMNAVLIVKTIFNHVT